MPKGTKPHRDKRSNTGADAWAKRKKVSNTIVTKWFQEEWRKDCLRARVLAGTLTEKNEIEMERLGIGKPTPLESGRSERT